MAAIATASEATGQLDIGWVLGAAFGVLRRRALDLLIIGAPFVLLPQVLAAFLPKEMSAVANLASGLPGLVFTGGVSLLVYRDLSGGKRIGGGEAIGEGARRFGSLWGVSFISGVGIFLGGLLLIIPGVFLLISWMPASAIVMVEDKTAHAALDRAWRLTKGARWRLAGVAGIIFAILLLSFAPFLALSIGCILLLGRETGDAILSFIIEPIWVLIIMVQLTVFPTAAYAGLRKAKEGGLGDVAAVFA